MLFTQALSAKYMDINIVNISVSKHLKIATSYRFAKFYNAVYEEGNCLKDVCTSAILNPPPPYDFLKNIPVSKKTRGPRATSLT